MVEPLGSMMDVFVHTPEKHRMVARVTAEPIKEDSTVHLFLDMEKTHVFAPGTYGENLTLRQQAAAPS